MDFIAGLAGGFMSDMSGMNFFISVASCLLSIYIV